MVYDRLNSAVDGLVLGNGTVYNFIDYIGRKHLTGGIMRYTLNRGYFFNNISSNYETGLSGRYGYGTNDFENADVKEKIEGSTGEYMDNGVMYKSAHGRDRIGDYYAMSAPMNNSAKNFMSINDFSALGEEFMYRNLRYNADEDAFKNRYADDGDDYKFVTDGFPYESVIGGDVVEVYPAEGENEQFNDRPSIRYSDATRVTRTRNWGYTEAVTKSQGLDNYVYESMMSNPAVSHNPDFTKHRMGKEHDDLQGGGRSRRLFLTKYFKQNRFVSSSPLIVPKDYYKSKAIVYENFGDYYEKNDIVPQLSTIDNIGLFDYYGNLRETYKSNTFWYGSSYGVATNSVPESYGVGDGVRAKKATIDPAFNGGTFRTNTPNKKSATYGYYQESDKGASVTSFKDINVADGFDATIDNFNSSSRLMRNINRKFATNEIKSLVNRFHTSVSPDEVSSDDQLISAYDAKYGLSRGRNLLKERHENDDITGFNNPYCRVWTAHYQYSKMKDRIRPFMDGGNFMSIKELQADYGKMRPNNGAQRLSDYSTLQDNGFVKITPYHDGKNLAGGRDSLKRYMFSIENLAWKNFNTPDRLSNEQIGPFGGRIMWFPPYNIKFTENVNVSWRDNDFIGRGEKIYTYVNTDRGGTLNFTLLIDHPSIINQAVGKDKSIREEAILRFFAGCGMLDSGNDASEDSNNETVTKTDDEDTTPRQRPESQYIEKSFIMFYPNNFSAKKYYNNMSELVEKIDAYEMSTNVRPFTEMDSAWEDQKLYEINYDNVSKYGLNLGGWPDAIKARISELLRVDVNELMPYSDFKNLSDIYAGRENGNNDTIFGYPKNDYEIDSIVVDGFASDHGYLPANKTLAKDRATTMKKLATYFCGAVDADKITYGSTAEISITKDGVVPDVNDIDAKIARSSIIRFKIKLRDDITPSIDELNGETVVAPDKLEKVDEAESGETANEVVMTFNGDDDYTYQNEFLYFEELKATDPLVHKSVVDKVRFFNPAFHSITPEGFNARLNFLHQCTRQGPTIGSHSGDQNEDKSNMSRMAGNLSFGMAPYCILRIGDFYYSKIVIDSLSIDYDNNGGPQWDLNPEGAGVQPMMANISMNFHFIGGQDIEGPVAQLQNALTFNYYANSSVYTPDTQTPIPSIIVEDNN